MSDRDATPGRIAIKLGSSSLNGGAKKHARPTPASSLGKRHRAQALAEPHSGSEDDEGGANDRHEEITTYGPDGASADDRRQRRRTRSGSPDDRDSKSRRKGSNRDSERRRDDDLKETDPADKDKDVQWGLTINKKPKREEEQDRGGSRGASGEDAAGEKEKNVERKARSADEEAMDALLGNDKDRKRAGAFEGDADRDPVPEDYEKVPIDDFGAHLLKGFGWDGKMVGKVKDVRKHANLTGLGAKGKGAEDLGAWSQKPVKDGGSSHHDKPRRPRLDDYRREEEKKKQRREERHRERASHRDSRESSHRRERDGDRDRSRDRHREKDRDRDSNRR
ncbi:hypothetical protein GE09DRAFT_101549 [Coniochaeta sp. 2T2.1]|nr:hypothetical protein GE09DRAFT_101549 [Coniochaeta sp. 2T2.1]